MNRIVQIFLKETKMTNSNRSQSRVRSALAIAAAAATSTMMQHAAMGQVSYSGGSYVQNFSGLTNADQQQWLQANGAESSPVAPIWTDNSTIPGWFAYSPGSPRRPRGFLTSRFSLLVTAPRRALQHGIKLGRRSLRQLPLKQPLPAESTILAKRSPAELNLGSRLDGPSHGGHLDDHVRRYNLWRRTG